MININKTSNQFKKKMGLPIGFYLLGLFSFCGLSSAIPWIVFVFSCVTWQEDFEGPLAKFLMDHVMSEPNFGGSWLLTLHNSSWELQEQVLSFKLTFD